MKTHKSVLKSSLVMLVLFAVAGSGVAQAQECIARADDATTARAEGITEAVGGVELLCRTPEGFSFGVPDETTISIELNTQVTNQITSDRIIDSDGSALTYTGVGGTGGPTLGGVGNYTGTDKEVLSEDGDEITWKIDSDDLGFSTGAGDTVTIAGIRANASMVGDGGEIAAVVRVNGEVAHSGSLKLADVKTGLEIKVAEASGVQCASTDTETAMITIKEAIMAGISANGEPDANDGLVVDFLNIPEGVTVTVPNMIALPVANGDVTEEMVNITFALTLVTDRTAGVTTNEDDDTKSDVQLSQRGSGSAIYMVTGMDDTLDGEWVILPVDFKWTAGNLIDMGEVDVSLHPVSTRGDANFDDENVPTPRFVASNNPMTIISVSPCKTTLVFPFVTAVDGYYTGIAVTNTSAQNGACAATFVGDNQPTEAMESPVVAERQWVLFAPDGFQGYLTVDCSFQKGKGFAFISNPDLSVAHGYLAQEVD
jgi:hypothetical protein